VEGSPTPENKDLCMANATRSFAFRGRGDQETWAGGRVVSSMQDPRVGNPHNVHLSPQPVSVELCLGGLGPAWQARDPGELLETQPNRAGMRRRLFWFMFATMSWTLWITRNMMVIEKLFPRCASHSVFKMLAFLQLWYPLTGSGWMACYEPGGPPSHHAAGLTSLATPWDSSSFCFMLGMFVLLPQRFRFLIL
jgi:hypothetical protein